MEVGFKVSVFGYMISGFGYLEESASLRGDEIGDQTETKNPKPETARISDSGIRNSGI